MNESTNMVNLAPQETVENATATPTEARVKPYQFRTLGAEDVVPMISILRKIGFNEIKGCFSDEAIKKIIGDVMGIFKATNTEKANVQDNDIDDVAEEDKNTENTNDKLISLGLSVLPTVLDVADIILGNIEKCEGDVFKLLSQTSNLSVEEVRKLELCDFAEMIIDFVKKEEFKDFIKVVSKLFK